MSGYCRARSGETYVFSILMNGVNPFGARALQDRMLAGDRRRVAEPSRPAALSSPSSSSTSVPTFSAFAIFEPGSAPATT